jgi:branched-subunit amino acid permease
MAPVKLNTTSPALLCEAVMTSIENIMLVIGETHFIFRTSSIKYAKKICPEAEHANRRLNIYSVMFSEVLLLACLPMGP